MIRLASVATPCGATSARLTRKQLQHQVSLNMEVRLARLGSNLFDLLTVLQILPPSASFSICHFLHGEHLGSCKGKYTMDHHGTSIEKQFINWFPLADLGSHWCTCLWQMRRTICYFPLQICALAFATLVFPSTESWISLIPLLRVVFVAPIWLRSILFPV